MSLDQGKMMIAYDRKRTSTLTLDEQPGAHTGATRQYIPGYSDSNIVYLDTASGNDSNDGSTELLAKLTYASAATAAGSTKKIRVVNDGAALSTNITKPTEMKRGASGTISSSLTAPVDTWTQAATPGLSGNVRAVSYSPKLKIYVASNDSGKTAYSTDGNVWTVNAGTLASGGTLDSIEWVYSLGKFFLGGENATIAISTDGQAWTETTIGALDTGTTSAFVGFAFSQSLSRLVAMTQDGGIAYSDDFGASWDSVSSLLNTITVTAIIYSEYDSVYIMTSEQGVYRSADGVNWTAATTQPSGQVSYIATDEAGVLVAVGGSSSPLIYLSSNGGVTWADASSISLTTTAATGVAYVREISRFIAANASGQIAYSSDGNTWTNAATPSFGGTAVRRFANGPLLGRAVAVGNSGKIARSTAYANTISASVAGFSIQAVQYSGTPTLYNCTLRNPGTTAAVSLNGCRVNYGAEIDADTGTHRATLFIGDTYFTTTPASQNAFSLNSNTFGGKCYILNSSQTGYEQIRDNLFADGIDATWPVTVSGRDNVQGVSSNALFGFEVTFNDPKFVDETDYALQYQTNGYDRNSLAAGRSNIYYNSAGGRRDIGAWSYIESAVTYYHAKTAYISKPTKISVTYEETVSEQQGDNGPVSVYTKPSRVKEILTLVYDVTEAVDRAIFDYIRTLRDKGVKVQLFPEWGMNGSTVTVNGNQSAGVEFLTIDAAQVFNGLFLTIAGERYYVLRASPNNTAATKLILDRPLESNVSDNDVITTNYPPGAGEYQFSPPPQLTLEYVDPDTLLTFMRGQTLRFVREWSP